jgi:hypothetical protein
VFRQDLDGQRRLLVPDTNWTLRLYRRQSALTAGWAPNYTLRHP